MALFANKELNSLDDLLVDQLHDLYDAEHRITKALPKMAKAAEDPPGGWHGHSEAGCSQINRLE